MIIQCAWCKQHLGEKAPLRDKAITHSICQPCTEKMLKARSNPDEFWHLGKEEEAKESEKHVKKASLKDFYHGKSVAHFESALEERAKKKTRKNPLAIFTVGNPPKKISATIEGIVYNRCLEVRAEKTGSFQKGHWRHPFSKKSQVQILALDNGDLLLHSVTGVRLWKED